MTKVFTLVLLLFSLVTANTNSDLFSFPQNDQMMNTQFSHKIREGRPSFPSLQSYPQLQINSRPANNFAPATSNIFKPEVQSKVHFNVTNSEERRWSNHVNNILSHGVTKFAIHMDRAIDANRPVTSRFDRENVVFSPLNLAGTLAVVLLGSGGRTFDEISRILGFEVGIDISGHSEVVHQMFGVLLDSIQMSGDSSEIFSAGSVFVQRGYSIRNEFATIAQSAYKNDIIDLDFQQRPDLARRIINNWVNVKTQGKISSILPENPSPDTKVILASALYFNGEWNQHFFRGATKRKPFYLASGQTINVDMMYNGGEFPFYEDKQLGVKILGLPYKDSDSAITGYSLKSETTMYVLLPTATDSNALNDLESRITPEVINSLISKMINTTCIIAIPRMKLSSTLSLNRALQSLGLTSLFTPGAANLGLLSTGLNNNYPSPSQSTSDSIIFSRINSEDDTDPTVSSTAKDFSGKKNYFRYTDSPDGYNVQQWSTGAYIEKIHRRIQKRQVKSNRQIDPGFLEFIKAKGFRSYGLDDIRNSANFVNPGLYASDVLHKVEIDITETGTVAAATSSVILAKSGGQKIFNGNRPFLFFIRHEPSTLILFWGTVNKPSPNY